jgi:hypothetical protein
MAVKDTAMGTTGLFIQALNEMIDSEEKWLTALNSRVPNIVVMALYGIAIIASAFAGYASGLETRRSQPPIYVMGTLACAIILLIQDLDRPSAGFINVSQQPMLDTAASIASFAE